MKQHKWHKEIKAWADGAEIEYRETRFPKDEWLEAPNPYWDCDKTEFRIKPQPKEPQYLYVWNISSKIIFTQDNNGVVIDTWDPKVLPKYIGKIKIEVEE